MWCYYTQFTDEGNEVRQITSTAHRKLIKAQFFFTLKTPWCSGPHTPIIWGLGKLQSQLYEIILHQQSTRTPPETPCLNYTNTITTYTLCVHQATVVFFKKNYQKHKWERPLGILYQWLNFHQSDFQNLTAKKDFHLY